ncbi:uncharacterized protein Tco025E_08824 [Trypanosoma conorhini]|uniref:Uncharacterized protein n=1 Tax=Trypanosoma conorhini TaxID=83891 RepID=A0A422N4C9_9TRYP|nr:uncharacterized protein Tco025E_08824 [Trypanosoma conorhini]RNF00328.1 hypothetical protein Tco025E_08824 [Trypanosoma conorhini]
MAWRTISLGYTIIAVIRTAASGGITKLRFVGALGVILQHRRSSCMAHDGPVGNRGSRGIRVVQSIGEGPAAKLKSSLCTAASDRRSRPADKRGAEQREERRGAHRTAPHRQRRRHRQK